VEIIPSNVSANTAERPGLSPERESFAGEGASAAQESGYSQMFATITYQECGQTLMGHLLILNK
jgi:hypothetical protein